MAKCPRCLSRKGKRYCPALRENICPQCCADERLKTIRCPKDCEHLSGEIYQHKRRRERALSLGKAFIEANGRLFVSSQARDFAFKLQADIFYFAREHGPVSDRALADALDSLKGLTGKIFVPERNPHPILAFLTERLEDSRHYPDAAGFGPEERARSITILANHVRSLGQGAKEGDASLRHYELIASFFGALDFEADLDYSPADPRASDASVPERRSPSGLILP